jgi:hypothetical protein
LGGAGGGAPAGQGRFVAGRGHGTQDVGVKEHALDPGHAGATRRTIRRTSNRQALSTSGMSASRATSDEPVWLRP